jgi:hypothetical protein
MHKEAQQLLDSWCKSLFSYQISHKDPRLNGGLLCPSCCRIHGRTIDAIYPFLKQADLTNDSSFIEAAWDIFAWNSTVDLPDGSWINELRTCPWNGTTVFAVTAIAESLLHFPHLLTKDRYNKIYSRLHLAAKYILNTFTVDTGNINYPITATYALAICGDLFDDQRMRDRARYFAHNVHEYLTDENSLLFGECGIDGRIQSRSGLYPIDLAYNVEESLPALLYYAHYTNDKEIKSLVKNSFDSHLKWMLPDGAWDNSWGTRNYKWTYWGTRTADGCLPALALLSKDDPRYSTAIEQRLKLLQDNTHDGLLTCGPHYHLRGESTCLHHSFSRARSLACFIHNFPEDIISSAPLPRSEQIGVQYFSDINSYQLSQGSWRTTITDYDWFYRAPSGTSLHASGGAISMLWHNIYGPVYAAGLTENVIIEPDNTPTNIDPNIIIMTPHCSFNLENTYYNSLYSPSTDICEITNSDSRSNNVGVRVKSKLYTKDGKPLECLGLLAITHLINEDFFTSTYTAEKEFNDTLWVYLPIISSSLEDYSLIDSHTIRIQKPKGILTLSSSSPLEVQFQGRGFNYAPGFESIPLRVSWNPKKNGDLCIQIS